MLPEPASQHLVAICVIILSTLRICLLHHNEWGYFLAVGMNEAHTQPTASSFFLCVCVCDDHVTVSALPLRHNSKSHLSVPVRLCRARWLDASETLAFLHRTFTPFFSVFQETLIILFLPQVTTHTEPVSQSMNIQQPAQSQYNMPDRDKQLLFSEFEDLSASFRSLYKSVFEQSFSQQGELEVGGAQ